MKRSPRLLFGRTRLVEDLERAAVVERQHQVLVRFLEPDLDQLRELLRMLLGEVLGLGAVHVHVVQLPHVLVEVSLATDRRVQGDGLPAVHPDAARAEHRVVLPLLRRRRRRGASKLYFIETPDSGYCSTPL